MYPTMSKGTISLNYKKPFTQYVIVFFTALLVALLIFIPFIVMDGGTFNYIGDYNCQQMAFYVEASESVRNGEIFWNWNTDLGANFIGSYAFYLVGSPFFWMTLLLPLNMVSASIPFILCLKIAVAATTSFGYLKRIVNNKNLAFIGAMLYAFSGFSFYNIFFNHFHDIIAFFPLMLIGTEKLLGEGKKGFMAFAVFLNAMTNYYFFVAEVVFVIIYFLIGLLTKRWENLNFRRFLAFAFESVAGFAAAAFIVLPAVLTTLQIGRASVRLSGWALITYYEPQRPLQILQAFFLPPEICSLTNMLPDAGGKWSSVTAWLPLFGAAGTMTWLSRKKNKDFFGYMVITLVVFAFVPVLNSSFQLFSNNYYTRWFFSLTLMLSACTIKAIEECSFKEWIWGTVKSGAFALGLAVPILLIKNPDEDRLSLAQEPELLLAHVLIAVICIILTLIAIHAVKTNRKKSIALLTVFTLSFTVLFGWFYLGVSKGHGSIPDDAVYSRRYIYGRWNMTTQLNDGERIDFINSESNSAMYWNMPTIRTFHSVVPGSIFDFYKYIGEKRDVKSDPDYRNNTLKSLLSVKYLFVGPFNEVENPSLSNYTFLHSDNDADVYLYNYYVPMGFTYDSYVTKSDLSGFPDTLKDDVMLHTLLIDDDDEDKVSDILSHENSREIRLNLSLEDDSEKRAENTCYNFMITKNGFEADFDSEKERIVFFSVPYEDGWSAKVNYSTAQIIRSNVGFMAVRVPAGTSHISFSYMTPGLKTGAVISGAAVLIVFIYAIIGKSIPAKKMTGKKTGKSLSELTVTPPQTDAVPQENTSEGL